MQPGDVDPFYLKMPHVESGMTVGLFGGSFNPPHDGHVLVADIALRRLGLEQLWWMVTPGNPLKSRNHLAPLAERIALSEKITHDPRIKVTAFEQSLGQSYTARTLEKIRERNRGIRFVWIMGADNLKNFHLWQDWQKIACTFPIAVIDRPGDTLSYLSSKMAKPLIMRVLTKRMRPALPGARPRLDLHSWASLTVEFHGAASKILRTCTVMINRHLLLVS